MSGALHLLLMVAIAAPPTVPDPSACAPDDLRCMGNEYAASARLARSGEERAQSLYSAHRAFLRLYDRDQDSGDLCRAHELIRQARKGPAGELGERLAASERETQSRLRGSGIDCGAGRSKRRTRPSVATTAAQPPAEVPAEQPTASSFGESELAPVPAATGAARRASARPGSLLTAPRTSPSLAADPEVEPRGPVFPVSAARPATPLLIGGGVALGMSLVLGGLSIYYGTTGLGTRRRCIDDPCTTINDAVDSLNYKNEREAYEQDTARAYVTGFAGGAALATAVTLLAVGARRRAKNLALGPMLRPNAGGVLFTGRF